MFSGSFGVRSIVLCKCSGKYIDIYFILKTTCFFITSLNHWNPAGSFMVQKMTATSPVPVF